MQSDESARNIGEEGFALWNEASRLTGNTGFGDMGIFVVDRD